MTTPAIESTFYIYSGLTYFAEETGYFVISNNYAISNIQYDPEDGATLFTLDTNGQLLTPGYALVAGTFSGQTQQDIYFASPISYPAGFDPLTCSVDSYTQLSCTSNNGGGNVLYVDEYRDADYALGYLGIGTSAPLGDIAGHITVEYP